MIVAADVGGRGVSGSGRGGAGSGGGQLFSSRLLALNCTRTYNVVVILCHL